MLKALVPVDGSACALAAVHHVIKLVRDREPLEVHLLNVQAPLHGDVTTFIAASVVQDFHREESEKALAHACELLREAGIPFTRHTRIGHAGEAIAHFAKHLGCDKVIMGTRGLGAVTQILLGSVTHAAIHAMDPGIPVTLVKGRTHPDAEAA